MAVDSNVAPVIIKRKKKGGGHGHHGGAWKVAYADFVTAMMAFFMLMWLLNATTEKQRKGLADYFNPTIAVARISGGGDGLMGGDSTFSENVLPRMGTGSTSLQATEMHAARGSVSSGTAEPDAAEVAALEELRDRLTGRHGESMVDDGLMRHVVTRVTDEGLVVELFETADAPLFEPDGSPTYLLRRLSQIIARAAEMVRNPLAIEGHVPAAPIVLARDSSWERSADRAGQMRALLGQAGVPKGRIARVTSHADREPARANPMDPRNGRIEVIFLRQK
ncbi:flagellar motor protein MotB [Salipiger sp. PrR002]|uniref:flagellar motor protein MotB n=1 Tax=Salipiger sp. PrR002 TaxID=2706489 RepID=UPI0013B60558|nr:flagellar motor protein MotB [Salipiger sp. PrR002]NDV98174.1 chemotaxis protein MotB [Salipiger sp. PrR002]NDW54886.1 chemotaxis protein MotB [Salipiger sp. PrR004]